MISRNPNRFLLAMALLAPSILIALASPIPPQAPAAAAGRQSAQDWPFGPYQIVANWPKPLPDTRHSHNGWTWGSMGSVFAETPDRIWVAQRGELPLPAGSAPWTPYAALNPSRGNSNSNTDGLSATCQPAQLRGWELRSARTGGYSLWIVDISGCRSSMRMANSSTCGRSARRPGLQGSDALVTNHIITSDGFIWAGDTGAEPNPQVRSEWKLPL